MILLDSITQAHVVFLGQLLNLSPKVFISHMWRSFFQRPLDFGLPLVEASSAPGIASELHNPVTGDPHPVLLTSDLPSTLKELQPASGDAYFARIIHYVSIEEIRQRHWAHVGDLSKTFRKAFERHSNALGGRRVKGPLYWVHEQPRETQRWRRELPVVTAHASIDYVTSTSLFVMEGSRYWPSQYGKYMQPECLIAILTTAPRGDIAKPRVRSRLRLEHH